MKYPRWHTPASSIARNSPYTAVNPPGTPSASTAARVTTPWRSSSTSASARARSRGEAAGKSRGATSDQRPRAAGSDEVGRARLARRTVVAAGTDRSVVPFRSGSQASLVTRPAHTSSHRSASTARSAPPTSATRSEKKLAPRRASTSSNWCSRSSGCGCSSGTFSRRYSRTRPGPAPIQTSSPPAQARSSESGETPTRGRAGCPTRSRPRAARRLRAVRPPRAACCRRAGHARCRARQAGTGPAPPARPARPRAAGAPTCASAAGAAPRARRTRDRCRPAGTHPRSARRSWPTAPARPPRRLPTGC